LTDKVIGAAIEVHRSIGPGLLESAYRQCLCHELNAQGLKVRQEVALPVSYKGIQLECGYRLDVVVNDQLVLELKTVETLLPIHQAQLLTYMRLGGFNTGLLINFHVPMLTKGIKRLRL
jgi:GxxExxY protein